MVKISLIVIIPCVCRAFFMQAPHFIHILLYLCISSLSIASIGQTSAQTLQWLQLLFILGRTFLMSINFPFLSFGLKYGLIGFSPFTFTGETDVILSWFKRCMIKSQSLSASSKSSSPGLFFCQSI